LEHHQNDKTNTDEIILSWDDKTPPMKLKQPLTHLLSLLTYNLPPTEDPELTHQALIVKLLPKTSTGIFSIMDLKFIHYLKSHAKALCQTNTVELIHLGASALSLEFVRLT